MQNIIHASLGDKSKDMNPQAYVDDKNNIHLNWKKPRKNIDAMHIRKYLNDLEDIPGLKVIEFGNWAMQLTAPTTRCSILYYGVLPC